jgi:hypothetical protein
VSRHHMLPPIIYTPVPRPKKTENRPKTKRIQNKASTEDAGDIEQTGEVSATRGLRTALPPSQTSFTPIDGAERRIPSTTGKLSESTLKELLLVQEQDQGSVSGVGAGAPATKE